MQGYSLRYPTSRCVAKFVVLWSIHFSRANGQENRVSFEMASPWPSHVEFSCAAGGLRIGSNPRAFVRQKRRAP